MKYYYDDPLAAAWMAKHHGMRFVIEWPKQHKRDPEEVFFSDGVPFTRGGSNMVLFHLHLHPDSLPLLEPQEGDFSADGWEFKTALQWWLKAYCEEGNPDRIDVRRHVKHWKRTAIRNGIAFHWPKEEQAA